MSKKQKSGEKANNKGKHKEVGPRGGDVKNARLVKIKAKNTKLPPTKKKGNKWKKVK